MLNVWFAGHDRRKTLNEHDLPALWRDRPLWKTCCLRGANVRGTVPFARGGIWAGPFACEYPLARGKDETGYAQVADIACRLAGGEYFLADSFEDGLEVGVLIAVLLDGLVRVQDGRMVPPAEIPADLFEAVAR